MRARLHESRQIEHNCWVADGGVAFGQLLGMCDHISYSLGALNYKVYKYVPYGPVLEVVPYLIRRAEENSDVLGGVGKELRMLSVELGRRFRSTLEASKA
jgi:proline dehydrogenase